MILYYDLFFNSKIYIYATCNNHRIESSTTKDPSSSSLLAGFGYTAATINNKYEAHITIQYHVRSKSWK